MVAHPTKPPMEFNIKSSTSATLFGIPVKQLMSNWVNSMPKLTEMTTVKVRKKPVLRFFNSPIKIGNGRRRTIFPTTCKRLPCFHAEIMV